MTSPAPIADVPEPLPQPTRRRWRQFSLRTLLLAILVLGVLFGLFAIRLQRARRQAAAVATIRRLGGNVDYDFRYKRTTGFLEKVPRAESQVPALLLSWLGEDFFHEVVISQNPRLNPKSEEDIRAFWTAISQLRQIELLQAGGKWIDGR